VGAGEGADATIFVEQSKLEPELQLLLEQVESEGYAKGSARIAAT